METSLPEAFKLLYPLRESTLPEPELTQALTYFLSLSKKIMEKVMKGITPSSPILSPGIGKGLSVLDIHIISMLRKKIGK